MVKEQYEDIRFTDDEILNQIKAYRPVMERIFRKYFYYQAPDFGYKGAIFAGIRYRDDNYILGDIKCGSFKQCNTLKEAVKKAMVKAANLDWYYKYEEGDDI